MSDRLREELAQMNGGAFTFSRDMEVMVGRTIHRAWVERVIRALGCECPEDV
jgi:hypothetical protein